MHRVGILVIFRAPSLVDDEWLSDVWVEKEAGNFPVMCSQPEHFINTLICIPGGYLATTRYGCRLSDII